MSNDVYTFIYKMLWNIEKAAAHSNLSIYWILWWRTSDRNLASINAYSYHFLFFFLFLIQTCNLFLARRGGYDDDDDNDDDDLPFLWCLV